MTLIIVCLIAAVVGFGVGFVLANVLPLPKGAGFVLGAIFAVSGAGIGYFLANQDVLPREQYEAARAELDAKPDILALKTHYPADYAALQTALTAAEQERMGAAGVSQIARQAANAVMLRQARLASDDNLIALMTLRRDKGQAIADKSITYCYDFFRGARLSFDPDTVVGADLIARERQVTADILAQTATAPVKNASGAEKADGEMETALKQYYDVELRDQINAKARAGFPEADQTTIRRFTGRRVAVEDPNVQTLMCKFSIAQLTETLKLPKDKAATVYRINLSRGL